MQGRTFLRTLIDNLFIKNPISKTFIALVNFCNEQNKYGCSKLKFYTKMPLYNNVNNSNKYKNRFIFDSSKLNGVSHK